MEQQKFIELPFAAILVNAMASALQDAVCVDIDQHDFAQLLQKDGKGIYQAEDGKQLHFSDANLLQTFGVVEELRTVTGRVETPAHGATFMLRMAFVAMAFHGQGAVNLWRGLSVFKPRKIFFGCGLNSATPPAQVDLSGKISDQGARVELNPMTVTQKYFAEQLAKMQANQLEISAFEARFDMLVENVCDLCLTLKQES
jgi:hypothetical protein